MNETLKNFIKNIPFATIILSFFFLCGALYLVGFWSVFNIDWVDLIQLGDVPKYFIFPFLIVNGLFGVYYVIRELILEEDYTYTKSLFVERKKSDFSKPYLFILYQFIRFPAIFIYSLIVVILLHDKYQYSQNYWMWSSIILGSMISVRLENKKSLIELIPLANLRSFICFNLIFLPSFSYVLGKSKGITTFNNSNIKYTSRNIIPKSNKKLDSLSMKYIMSLNNKIILSSQDNKQIVIVRAESLDSLVIRKK